MDELSLPSDPDPDFERLASALRADSRDLSTFLEVMASKFEGALPGRARVEYHRGLLRRSRQVRTVALSLGEDRFELVREQGAVVARRTRVVRGIALKTEQLSIDEWLGELSHSLVREGRTSSRDRVALERLLG